MVKIIKQEAGVLTEKDLCSVQIQSVHTLVGDKGERGIDGLNGIDGRDGIDGKDGRDGRDGIDGKDGITFVPKFDEKTGILSFENNGGLKNPKPIKLVSKQEQERLKSWGFNLGKGGGGGASYQADWNQTDVHAPDYIKNKPEGGASSFDQLSGSPYDNQLLANALNSKANDTALQQTNQNLDALTGDVENLAGEVDSKQPIISDLEEIRVNAQTGAGLAPQVEVNTQRIEDLTTSRIPDVIYRGTPKITGGQISNFSTDNYLLFPFEDISRGLPFDIYFSFTTSNDVVTQQNIIDSKFGIALAISNSKGVMALSSNGTSWDIGSITGTNTILPNTTYYVKYSWTGTEYNASLSTNDTEYIPDMVLSSNLSPYKTTIYIGGCNQQETSHTPHPFTGIINFTKSKVVVNNITVWEGMADVGLASRANVSLNNIDAVGQAKFDAKANKSDLDQYKVKVVQQNGVDLIPDSTGKVNVVATVINIIEDD